MSPAQSAGEAQVTVAILTYRRPQELARSLPLVFRQVDAVNADPTVLARVDVLIVDNDPAAGAADVVAAKRTEQAEQDPTTVVRYAVEPRPGIAAARNRALDESEGSRLLVFIDDDEYPTPGWLAALLETWRGSGAAAVMGRVVSEFDVQPDAWVEAGDFFRRRSMPSGTEIEIAAAGNLLLDLDRVRASGVRFDERLGLAGGEDTLFSRSLGRAGERIIWCEESVAVDRVPAERLERTWLARRSFHKGNAEVLIRLLDASGPAARTLIRARAALGGTARMVVGGGRILLGRATGSLRHQAYGTKLAERGRGMVANSVGRVRPQYDRAADRRNPRPS
jgi:succinoglycan biosynthesis protein ExoM